MFKNIVIEVLLVVDLVDKLVHAMGRLYSTAFQRLWSDNLAIVDDKLLVKRGYDGQRRLAARECTPTVLLHLHSQCSICLFD